MRFVFFGGDVGEDFVWEVGVVVDVEDEGGGFEVEEFEGVVGYGGLDVLDVGGGGVFVGFDVVVVDVCEEGVFGVGYGGWLGFRYLLGKV